MNIVRYKKGIKGKYIVELDDGRIFNLYEDVILKCQLLLKKEFDDKDIDLVNELNMECEVYYAALDCIKLKMRSISDLRCLLLKKEYSPILIDKALDKLIKQGYLSDVFFVKSYINNQIITTSKGPYRLEKELLNKNIDSKIIKNELKIFTSEEQVKRIRKIIDKGIKSNHTRGGNILKQKIYNDVKILGYDDSLINSVIDTYVFENDVNIAKKEYEKMFRRYSKKYSGIDLKNKIKEGLCKKGLVYDVE